MEQYTGQPEFGIVFPTPGEEIEQVGLAKRLGRLAAIYVEKDVVRHKFKGRTDGLRQYILFRLIICLNYLMLNSSSANWGQS